MAIQRVGVDMLALGNLLALPYFRIHLAHFLYHLFASASLAGHPARTGSRNRFHVLACRCWSAFLTLGTLHMSLVPRQGNHMRQSVLMEQ